MQQGGNRHDAQDRPAWPGPEPDASTTIASTAKKDCSATKLVVYETMVFHIMFQTGSVLHTLVHIMTQEV